ncbi:hypothetical protein [Candidatus Amarolinea aalborgensis]
MPSSERWAVMSEIRNGILLETRGMVKALGAVGQPAAAAELD